MDKFVLKSWISKRMFYFVGILNEVRNIFLPDCSQVFSQLNIRFRGISEPYKIQPRERNSLVNSIDKNKVISLNFVDWYILKLCNNLLIFYLNSHNPFVWYLSGCRKVKKLKMSLMLSLFCCKIFLDVKYFTLKIF